MNVYGRRHLYHFHRPVNSCHPIRWHLRRYSDFARVQLLAMSSKTRPTTAPHHNVTRASTLPHSDLTKLRLAPLNDYKLRDTKDRLLSRRFQNEFAQSENFRPVDLAPVTSKFTVRYPCIPWRGYKWESKFYANGRGQRNAEQGASALYIRGGGVTPT
jgi:hypothetical protein